MVIFRPDDTQKEMSIVAKEGFDDSVRTLVYEVGKGRTGACAEKNEVIRYDDVATHRDEFDQGLLEALEKAHRKPVSSWMAIPITADDKNYGVIKVVNSTYRCRWFTNEDQKVGENMALRLHVIISKFLQIERTEQARRDAATQAREAQRHAKEALAAREKAEITARQRQTDLMTMTHQLQGPLIPVIGTLGMLQRLSLKGRLQERLELAKALAEACLNLCWGISSSFAQDAGQKLSYDPVEIDVPTEMRKLCRMLQLANSREDITFRYTQDTDFPKLRMDFNVFTNVLFSLIHNAMKYAYDSS
jgi:K+-sensing histidine kinase KdpD